MIGSQIPRVAPNSLETRLPVLPVGTAAEFGRTGQVQMVEIEEIVYSAEETQLLPLFRIGLADRMRILEQSLCISIAQELVLPARIGDHQRQRLDAHVPLVGGCTCAGLYDFQRVIVEQLHHPPRVVNKALMLVSRQ